MRRWTSGILAVIALTAAGCGGGTTFANEPRPPTPVNLTVYINNARVSVSPSSVGAGPVVFIVSNAADQTVSLNIGTSDGSSSIGTTGPINPQSTAQVTVDFRDPGTYTVSAGKSGKTQAEQHQASSISSATLRIGKQRASASSQLLQP
jgi:hypothetical protein